jgi:hypothetical protein
MAQEVGNTLPDRLCEHLSGRDLSARMGEAILLTTTDAEGWPHPALLSYAELVAVDPSRLRLALYRTSRTSDNLRRSGKLTLCVVGPNMAYYIKATVAARQDPMEGFAHLVRFEARVESVLADRAREDLEPGAGITEGIRFDPGRPMAEALREWRAVMDGLRSDT